MADDASRVVVQLLGDTSNLDQKVGASSQAFSRSMQNIERSAVQAEGSVSGAFEGIAESSGNAHSAQLILQSTVRRTTDQFAAGAPIATIFAEHISALAEASALAGDKLGKFGAVMEGPWGIAITTAVSLAALLAQHLYEGADASDAHKKATDELADAIKDLNDVTGASVRTHEQEVQANLAAARAKFADTVATRQQTAALLEQAIARRNASIGGLGGGTGGANLPTVNAQNEVDALGQQLNAINAKIVSGGKDLAQAIRGVGADRVARQVEASLDKAAAAQDRYKDAVIRAKQAVAEGRITQAQEAQTIREAAAARDAAIEATKKHAAAHHGLSDAEREAAKAAREAAAAQRELDSEMSSVISKLDPAAAAAARYAETLKEITDLVRGGRLTPDQGIVYSYKAALAFDEDQRKNGPMAQATKRLDSSVPDISELLKSRGEVEDAVFKQQIQNQDKLKAQQERNVDSLAQIYERAFQGGSGNIWKQFEQDGIRTIALLLARFTVLQFATPGQGGFGNILSNLGSAAKSFGGSSGSSGGTSLFGSIIAALGGKASGGYVAPNSISRVNEQGGGVELLRMGSQGATVIPLGQTRAVQNGSGMTVIQHISVDGRNSVTPDSFARDILSQANDFAVRASAASGQATLKASSGQVAYDQKRGASN